MKGRKEIILLFLAFAQNIIMAYCYSCDFALPITIYLFFILLAFTVLFALGYLRIKQLKKLLEKCESYKKHEQITKEYGTKVTVVDATKEDQKINWEQALGIGFELRKRSKEKSK
jgi:cell division protein YceG involved in septum cleavage